MVKNLVSRNLIEEFYGGLGLRPSHYSDFISHAHNPSASPSTNHSMMDSVKWLEVITENYMESFGSSMDKLLKIRENYPIAMHGVSLSIGSPDPVDMEYLKKVKGLADKVEPFLISDHLCWTSVSGHNSHDLLPVPYTQKSLEHICDKVFKVQDFLKTKILLENPSTYIGFKDNDMKEWEFLSAIANRTGCGLLLDINNIYVSCFNFGWDQHQYMNGLPLDKVGQIHMAGHTDMQKYLFDTHSTPVSAGVWSLYEKYIGKLLNVPTMIEWDDDIPSLDRYIEELQKAEQIWKRYISGRYEVPAIL